MKIKSLIIRVLVGIPLIALFVSVLFFQNWLLKSVITAVMIISQIEIVRAAKANVPNLNQYVPIIAVVALAPIFYFFGYLYVMLLYAVSIFWLIVESVAVKKRDLNSLLMGIFTMLYPSVFFAFFFAIAMTDDGGLRTLMILLAYLGAMVTDTLAYFVGSKFGKHKLCPEISPKKSVEGAIAGYVFGFISILIIGLFFQNLIKTDIGLLNFIILGLILPALVQVGDLFASLVKRHFGIKDFSNIFPGHGGVLDRLDSGTFVCPVIFLYFTLIYGSLLL